MDTSTPELASPSTRIDASAEIRVRRPVARIGEEDQTKTEILTSCGACELTPPEDDAIEDAIAEDATAGVNAPPVLWNWSLLAELDWKRLHELVRALLHRSGIQMRVLRSAQDGSRIALIHPADNTTRAARSLMYLAGWKQEPFSDKLIKMLHEEREAEQAGKILLVQPFVASLQTHQIARANQIEIVDASRLLSMISNLPPDESQYLQELFTTGNYRTPSCPMCLQPMQQRSRQEATREGAADRDFVPTKSGTMESSLLCKLLFLASDLEWRFRNTVRAESIHIHGRFHGDCLCLGKFRLGPKAEFHGSVTAKSVEVAQGGLLNGDCTIRSGTELEKLWQPVDASMVWSCGSFPKCRGTLELR